jgi:hypothetical protein
MAKKQLSRNDSPPQGPVISVKNPVTPEKLAALCRVMDSPAPPNGFRKWFAATGIEIWASQILDNADLPADKELVEARGFREGSKEWHACEILRLSYLMQGFVGLGEAGYAAFYAFELGALLQEGAIWFSYRKQRQDAGAKPKHNPIVKRFVESRLRKDPSIKAAALWRSIPQDECEAVPVGKAKLFIGNDDRLHLIGKVEGFLDPRPIGRPLRFTSFRNYVTAAKKSLPR